MMFQRALPDVKGLGVTTCTPGFTRSFQLVMCLGLPLRTMITATELVTNPCVAFWFQLEDTKPAFTSRVTSGSSEKFTTSAFKPPATERLWSPEGPKDWLKLIPLPSLVAPNAGISEAYAPCGVE